MTLRKNYDQLLSVNRAMKAELDNRGREEENAIKTLYGEREALKKGASELQARASGVEEENGELKRQLARALKRIEAVENKENV